MTEAKPKKTLAELRANTDKARDQMLENLDMVVGATASLKATMLGQACTTCHDTGQVTCPEECEDGQVECSWMETGRHPDDVISRSSLEPCPAGCDHGQVGCPDCGEGEV